MILETEQKVIIEQKLPIRIILIMDDGETRIDKQYILQEDEQVHMKC